MPRIKHHNPFRSQTQDSFTTSLPLEIISIKISQNSDLHLLVVEEAIASVLQSLQQAPDATLLANLHELLEVPTYLQIHKSYA